jgi:Nucleotide modification associated domain 3
MNGLLVRVGIDSSDGGWNAPVHESSGEFAYVTITEAKPLRRGLARHYDELVPAVTRLGLKFPDWLLGQPTHLDPDFDNLTYGDQGQRGRSISKLQRGDVLAFFAGLRPMQKTDGALVYALIGLYVIDEIAAARSVPANRWHENAHTRREPGPSDIVVRARPSVSGRLKRCIPIGEYRERAYRVRRDLLSKWGGLDVKNGYVQRSARLPEFRNAALFYRWFLAQKPKLISVNNP